MFGFTNHWCIYQIFLVSAILVHSLPGDNHYTNSWAVELEGGLTDQEVNKIAADHGYLNYGKVVGNYYQFLHPKVAKRSVDHAEHHTERLKRHDKVLSAEQQIAKVRVKRNAITSHIPEHNMRVEDPSWSETWYLRRGISSGEYDMNVIPAWERGFTGKNIVVTILDDGIERDHPDLVDNYDSHASWDVNANDDDPMPRYDYTNENRHGTRCAGEVAASGNNSVCSIGVAYHSKIGGIRMLDGDVTDSVEAKSLSYNSDHIDIYSSSWGPDDNGRTVDGPGKLAKKSFEDGVSKGRQGKGSIFMWASGNGGSHADSCACDGYTNSIYTLSVSSASESNDAPWYLEECASTIATTYSSGANFGQKQIVSTDLRKQCTNRHTGTSASAPLAAGLVAVMLEANPKLTWRDVQYVTLISANPEPLRKGGEFRQNAVGRSYSHKFGYGLMDCGQMVENALKWTLTVPTQLMKTSQKKFPRENLPYTADIDVPECDKEDMGCIRFLEHVQLSLKMSSSSRGQLSVDLISPGGTRSTVLPKRRADTASAGFDDWPFMSVHFWGENPAGRWKFEIDNHGQNGKIESYQLIMYGVAVDPFDKNRSGDTEIECNAACDESGCFGSGADQCKHCAKGYKQVEHSNNCTIECPEGYYEDGSTCKSCPENCATCNVDKGCLTCAPGQVLDPDNMCAKECPIGYFHDKEPTCIPCSKDCTTCTSAHDCVKCSSHHDVVNGACVIACELKKYRDKSTGECVSCEDSNCQQCIGPDSCIQCTPQYNLYNGMCLLNCPNNTYSEGTREGGGVCYNCHEDCLTCYEGLDNNCQTCHRGYNLTVDHKCKQVKSCPRGQYLSPEGECQECHAECDTCHGPHELDCTSCKSGKYLKDGSCLSDCGIGFFHYTDESSEGHTSCQPCHLSCAICTGPSETECTSCAFGFDMIDENDAVMCKYNCSSKLSDKNGPCSNCSENCATCSGPRESDCLTCKEGYVLDQEGACVENCEDGFFKKLLPDNQDNYICHQCNAECLTCNGEFSNQCTSCDARLMLYSGSCVAIPNCYVSQYFDISQMKCKECDESCVTCSGPMAAQCTSCNSTLNRRLDKKTNQCVTCCLDGQARHNICCACKGDQVSCEGETFIKSNAKDDYAEINYTRYIGLSLLGVAAALAVWGITFLLLQYRSYGRCAFRSAGNTFLVDGSNAVKYSSLNSKEDTLYSALGDEDEDRHLPNGYKHRDLDFSD